jgi:NADH:ubiquinone oxidoreductase subunit E
MKVKTKQIRKRVSPKTTRLLIASAVLSAVVGCQRLGLRPGATGSLSDEDEWAITPRTTNSMVPRPQYDPNSRTSARQDLKSTSNSQPDSKPAQRTNLQALINDAAPQLPKLAKNETSPKKLASLDPAPSREELNVADTGTEEIDIDSALSELPAEFQSILKRQLAAARNHSQAAPLKPTSELLAKSQADSASSALAAGNTTENGQKKAKVTFRLSDEGSEEVSDTKDVALASASSNAATGQNDVSTAVAHTEANNAPTNNVVVTASTNNSPTANTQTPPSLPLPPASQISATNLPTPAALASQLPVPLPASHLPTTKGVENQTASNASWHAAVHQAIAALDKQIREQPAADENLRIHQELTLRMLYASVRKADEAMQPIAGLSDDENEYYRNQWMAMIEASNPDAMPIRSRHMSLVMNSQRKATGHLAAASNLEIRSMAFCSDVERYGVITKFPRYQFKPDEEVLLYCEVENVSTTQVREGFESQLQGSYEILDALGNRLVEQTLPMEPDVCQNVRRDYYMVYRIFMPQQIAAGNYKLRLTIEDVKARKYGQATLDLQIKK